MCASDDIHPNFSLWFTNPNVFARHARRCELSSSGNITNIGDAASLRKDALPYADHTNQIILVKAILICALNGIKEFVYCSRCSQMMESNDTFFSFQESN
jgi:hypothetical protein